MGPPEVKMSEHKLKAELKKEAFAADPDRFIDREDIVIAAVKQKGPNGEHGVGYLAKGNLGNSVLITSIYYLKQIVDEIVYAKKMAASKPKESGLIIPGVNAGGNGKRI